MRPPFAFLFILSLLVAGCSKAKSRTDIANPPAATPGKSASTSASAPEPALPAGTSTRSAREWFAEGEKLAEKKDYAGAIVRVKEAARLAPQNDYYWQTLAWLENNAGRHADALEHARQAIRLNDRSGYSYFFAGWAAYQLKDYPQARTYFQKVLDLGPEACGKENFEQAKADLEELREDVLNAKQFFEQGQELQKKKDLAGAIARVKEAVRLAPKNEYYWQTLAWLEMKANRHADALEHARTALGLNDRNGYAYFFAGRAAYELKEYDQARSHFHKVRELGPEKCGQVNFDSAGWYLEQVSEANLKAKDLVAQAKEARTKKDYEGAILKLKEAVRLAEKNAYYWQSLACVEIDAGHDDAALDHARKALQLDKDDGYNYFLVGLTAYQAQDLVEARASFEKVRQLGPNKCGAENHQSALEKLTHLSGRTYSVTWTFDPQKGAAGAVRVPLPATGLPYQTSTFKLTGAKRSELIQEDGERFLLVEPDGKNPFQLQAEVTVKAFSYKKQLTKAAAAAYPKETQLYLRFGPGIDPAHPRIAQQASELKGATPVATVHNILAWLKQHLHYDKEGIGTTAEEIMAKGHGHCVDYSKLFTALSRAAGIPTRAVRGVQKSTEPSAPPGRLSAHAWVEVYLSGVGWVPVEPQAPSSLGFYDPTWIRQCPFLYGGKNHSDDNALTCINQLETLAGTTPSFREQPVTP